MKRHDDQHLRLLLPASIVATILLAAFLSPLAQTCASAQGGGKSIALPVQKGVGKPYGSRDPYVCPDIKGAAPSAEMAKASVICNDERVVGVNDAAKLTLIEEVTVQVGRGRPYNPNTEVMDLSGIDTTVPVYPIRGSFKEYICEWAGERWGNIGRNCRLTEFPHAEGLCYKNEWGSWVCRMTDVMTSKIIATETAPPGATTPVNANSQNLQPPPADRKVRPTENENGFPKPDFSAMDKWFEIVKYEYSDDGKLYIWARRKREGGPAGFLMEFRDKDGVLVGYQQPVPDYSLNSAAVGEVAKTEVPVPNEAQMKRVATATLVRRVN